MSLLIDVQEVPWRILEMVQARILANRARKDQRQQDEEVRGLTRPRPQRKAMGATMTTYRRPEPVGLPAEDGTGWLLVPSDNELNAKVRGVPPFAFWRYEKEEPYNYYLPMQVESTNGPNGTPCIISPLAPEYIGDPSSESAKYYSGSRLKTFRDAPPEPKGKSFTFELMAKYGAGSGANADYGAFSVYTLYGGASMVVGWDGTIYPGYPPQIVGFFRYGPGGFVNDNYEFQGTSFISSRVPKTTTLGNGKDYAYPVVPQIDNPAVYHHFAIVQTPGADNTVRNVAFYADGVRFHQGFNIPQPFWTEWGRPYVSTGALVDDVANEFIELRNVEGQDNTARLHGIRYTERALYKGDTYTVPTSITRLA
jgi:hypothetical protein